MSDKIKCSHILVEKHSEAISLLERIQKGEKFGKLAKESNTMIIPSDVNNVASMIATAMSVIDKTKK